MKLIPLHIKEKLLPEKLHVMFQEFGLNPEKLGLPDLFEGSKRSIEVELLKTAFSPEKSAQILADLKFEQHANTLQTEFKNVVCNVVKAETCQIFFLQGRGGVGKTFFINFIATSLRKDDHLVWCCATTSHKF